MHIIILSFYIAYSMSHLLPSYNPIITIRLNNHFTSYCYLIK